VLQADPRLDLEVRLVRAAVAASDLVEAAMELDLAPAASRGLDRLAVAAHRALAAADSALRDRVVQGAEGVLCLRGRTRPHVRLCLRAAMKTSQVPDPLATRAV